MVNVELTEHAINRAKKYQVQKKFDKQVNFLKTNPRHNSLKLEPIKSLKGVYKFRIDKHYWGLVIKIRENFLRVYDIIKHL